MGLVSSEVTLVTQETGTAKSAVPAFPFSHTSFNPLLPDEPVTDIIDRNPHSGYDSNIIDQPPHSGYDSNYSSSGSISP